MTPRQGKAFGLSRGIFFLKKTSPVPEPDPTGAVYPSYVSALQTYPVLYAFRKAAKDSSPHANSGRHHRI